MRMHHARTCMQTNTFVNDVRLEVRLFGVATHVSAADGTQQLLTVSGKLLGDNNNNFRDAMIDTAWLRRSNSTHPESQIRQWRLAAARLPARYQTGCAHLESKGGCTGGRVNNP